VCNINTLIPKVNTLFDKWGEGRAVTSGLRTMADHQRIYAEKNAARAKEGLPPLSIPMGSKHLSGAAVDVADADGVLKKWCVHNLDVLQELGLYMEDPLSTLTWVHFQCIAPGSGKTIFKP
jgi:hypothetical protein